MVSPTLCINAYTHICTCTHKHNLGILEHTYTHKHTVYRYIHTETHTHRHTRTHSEKKSFFWARQVRA